MRSLIFGGAGMLGRAVAAEARARGWPTLVPSESQADICRPEQIRYWIGAFRPGIIFNCAAYTAVDACETHRDEAFAVNGQAVGHLAVAAQAGGACLVHVSTDYVFDGAAQSPYREEAPAAPRSVYGASKLEGERQALSYHDALVVRSSWLFGLGGPNFVETMLRLMEVGRVPLRVVDDQLGCPTYAPFLARALCDLAALGSTGLLHYRNREPVSWHDLAVEIGRWWDPSVEVQAVSTEEFPRPAARPAYSVLDVTRCQEALGREVEPWAWGLAEYLTARRAAGGSSLG